jgi:hypothetical protein
LPYLMQAVVGGFSGYIADALIDQGTPVKATRRSLQVCVFRQSLGFNCNLVTATFMHGSNDVACTSQMILISHNCTTSRRCAACKKPC